MEPVVVCGREFSYELLERVRSVVAECPELSRSALARQVCQWVDWKSPNGRWQEMSCRVALRRLEGRGLIELPPAKVQIPRGDEGRRDVQLEAVATAVSGSVEEIEGLELVVVNNRRLSALWNHLVGQHHYLGAGPLVGAQLRYLIASEHGYLGALAFSASAWQLAARDRWIAWSGAARQANLRRVVCNSRLLILPWVEVKNLASKVLALCVRRLGQDWEQLYGERPLLVETYVERGRFTGACYRAANWQWVGTTAGRGRQDRQCRRALPVKDVYVYALHPQSKALLCRAPAGRVLVRSQGQARRQGEARDWAEEEFGQVRLGDERLRKRLLVLARDFYARPQANIPQACGGNRARSKAAYRWLGHPAVKMQELLASHYQATARRVASEAVVLAVQDTTSFNYSQHAALEGAGPIGVTSHGGGAMGILMHDTMVYTTSGLPLGLIDVQVWARDPGQSGKAARRHELPIEAKESSKWLQSFGAAAALQAQCAQTTVVSVGDREADLYELFALALREKEQPKLLVRAHTDRVLAEGQGRLWEQVQAQAVCATQVVQVPRRRQQPARRATLAVRFAEVHLSPPRRHAKLPVLQLWAVLAQEVDAPAGVEPLEWMLLTTMEVSSAEQALEKLQWYTKRWNIEVFHRTLKSGCRIEERQLATVARIENCLAVDLVVAWRIVHLTMLGRQTPDLPCTVFFEEHEWKALYAFVHRSRAKVPTQAPPLREAMRVVASLGGFLGRKSDGEPGTKSLWLGLQRLDDIAACWLAFLPDAPLHKETCPVSRNPRYG